MTKKQTRDAWMYGALGFGVAALLALPAIPALMAYYRAKPDQKKRIGNTFQAVAESA
jgi:hypothetical protein